MGIRLFFFLLLLLSFFRIQAQDFPVVEEEGRKFYLYKVEKGNTLYGISKSFLVDIEQVIQCNPSLSEGLKTGELIRIPLSKENRKLEKANAPVLRNDELIHTVEKGETLYGLSKKYNITQDEILQVNPLAAQGLSVGMTIKIPLKKTVQPDSLSQERSWKTHKVSKGETLYSLARLYNVMIDSIPLVNNGLPEGLKEGMVINIPIRQEASLIPGNRPDTLYGFIKDIFAKDSLKGGLKRIALLLPFEISKNNSLELNDRQGQYSIDGATPIAISFYQGFKFAADSLWKRDSLEIYVFDVGGDSASVSAVLSKPVLKTMDLIVGPLYASSFTYAAKFSDQMNIPLISPFSQTTGLADLNPWVIKLSPSDQKVVENMAVKLDSVFPREANYILVNPNSARDKLLTTALKKNAPARIMFKESDWLTGGIKGLQSKLDPLRENVVIFPSRDRSLVTDFLTKLSFVENHRISVLGMEDWINYENVDIEYLERLNVTLPVSGFIDYSSPAVVSVVERYRTDYLLYADPFALRAMDVAGIALRILESPVLLAEPSTFLYSGYFSNYRLGRKGEEKGLINNSINIIQFNNYKYIRINGETR